MLQHFLFLLNLHQHGIDFTINGFFCEFLFNFFDFFSLSFDDFRYSLSWNINHFLQSKYLPHILTFQFLCFSKQCLQLIYYVIDYALHIFSQFKYIK